MYPKQIKHYQLKLCYPYNIKYLKNGLFGPLLSILTVKPNKAGTSKSKYLQKIGIQIMQFYFPFHIYKH